MRLPASKSYLGQWWGAITRPASAQAFVLGDGSPAATRFVALFTAACYGVYGLAMGIYTGSFPAFCSALKMPFLYAVTALVCFLPFYVFSALTRFSFTVPQCLRMLLLFGSAHAAALASYVPVAFFFSVSTSDSGYPFLFIMHVAVLASAGAASLTSNYVVFNASFAEPRRLSSRMLFAGWGVLYAFVGTHAAWTLRPWLNKPDLNYEPLRPIGGSVIEALLAHAHTLAGS